jgi:hypothetical protein
MKHAKQAVSFRIKNNETGETACFASKQNTRNGKFVKRNNETRFVSYLPKYETKRVLL